MESLHSRIDVAEERIIWLEDRLEFSKAYPEWSI